MPVFSGTAAADRIVGSADADQIYGLGGHDKLYGAGGNDWLVGGLGNDILVGGLGDDSYDVDAAGDQVVERAGEGVDRVRASVSHQLAANIEILTLTGTADINGFGNALGNVILGNSGNNVLNGGAGADAMAGGAGNDVYDVDSIGDRVVEAAGEGHDRVRSLVSWQLGANVEDLNLGGTGNLNGFGNALANIIIGNAGSNVLNGGAGDDLLIGRAGDDIYDVDSAGDQVQEASGEGRDRVRTSLGTYDLAVNVEELALTGGGFHAVGDNALDNEIVGDSGTDYIWATAGKDVLYGNGGNDRLIGGAGDDTLIGGVGGDEMFGGDGNDIYDVDSAGDTIEEIANGGYDRVRASITFTLAANVEELNLTGAGAVNGTGNALSNTLVGNAGANVLTGDVGDDVLIGAAGNDALYGGSGRDRLDGGIGSNTLAGGIGDDIYITDDDLRYYDPWNLDTLVERAGEGTDLVIASHSYALANNIENLILVGTEDGELIGNQLSNSITGNSGNNVLDGREGNDRLAGGDGDDTYVVDRAGDIVIENRNAGVDTVRSAFDYVLGANIENLVLEKPWSFDPALGTGNDLDNTIWGSDGDDILDGKGGNDTLIGGDGLNIYLVNSVGDVVIENDSFFSTGVVRASVSYTLSPNVDSLILLGGANLNGTGNATDNRIEGNDGSNILRGEAGIDYLIGGLGRDQVYGGDDDDYIYIDKPHLASGEIYDGGSGYDRIELIFDSTSSNAFIDITGLTITGVESITSLYQTTQMTVAQASKFSELDTYGLKLADGGVLDFTANPNVSIGWLVLSSQGNTINLTGRTFSSTIDGGAGADTIWAGNGGGQFDGAGGDDRIVGGAGGDSIDGGSGDDHIEAGQGNDFFLDGGDGADVIDGGAGNDVISGDAGDDRLIGGGGDDRLSGGAGNDTMAGGTGHDFYSVDSASELVTEKPGEGTDTVQASLSYALGASLENLILSGAGVINGTGNSLNNMLEGNEAGNILSGGLGNDTLIGYGGSDVLIGGAGSDIFHLTVQPGIDTISDFNASQGDKITFSKFGTFSYLGGAAFTASRHTEARFEGGLLLVDVRGLGATEITIKLTGITDASQLHDSDFLLF